MSLLIDADTPPELDIDCMAAAIVASLGGAAVMEERFGLTVETIDGGSTIEQVDLSTDEAFSVADGVMGCGLSDAMASQLAVGMPAEDAACMAREIEPDLIRDIFASSLMSPVDGLALQESLNEDLFASMIAAMSACDISIDQLGG